MNRQDRIFFIAGFLIVPWVALAGPAEDAARFAESALGMDKGIPCAANGNPVVQWKFNILAGGGRVVEGNYLEAFQLSPPKVTSYAVDTTDRLNGLSWSGTVEWFAESHRYYDNHGSILGFRGLGEWSRKNPILSARVEHRDNRWNLLDGGVRNPIVGSTGCANFAGLAEQARREKDEKLRALHEEEVRRHESNQQQYPVAPHKRDPYYVPRQAPNSRECFPGAGRACY